jgi:hypothetical protein
MSGQLQEVKKTAEVFIATGKPFPSYLTSESTQIQPSRGVIAIEDSAVGIGRGNPGVTSAVPLPLPLQTPTLTQG